jgi:hypothetical protein
MKSSTGLRVLTTAITALVMFLVSCSDSNKIDYSANDNANVQSEANADAQTEETDDMAAQVLSSDNGTLSGSREDGSSSGRIIQNLGDRFLCADSSLLTSSPDDTIRTNGERSVSGGGLVSPSASEHTKNFLSTRGNRRSGRSGRRVDGKIFSPSSSFGIPAGILRHPSELLRGTNGPEPYEIEQ